MRHFKKAISVSSVFFLVVFLVSTLFISAYMRDEKTEDTKTRADLAGEIDYIVLGASHGLRAYVPKVLDEKLGCCSYNLSGALTTFNGREALLKEELGRNEIGTVVVELSYNAFTRPTKELEGNLHIIPRLNSFSNRFNFFLKNVNVNEYDFLYSYYFIGGTSSFLDMSKEKIQTALYNTAIDSGENLENSKKGFLPGESIDLTLNPSEISKTLNSITLETNINQDNVDALERIINLCNSEGAEVIFIVTPLADSCIWSISNLDETYNTIKDIASIYNVDLYDFNLLKNRYNIFFDDVSFCDGYHLSETGAYVFTEEYCKIIKKVKSKKDVSNLFFDTYSEMKRHSPYNNVQ